MSTPNNKPPNWDYDLPTFMCVPSSMPRKPPKSVQFVIEPANDKKTEDLADDDGDADLWIAAAVAAARTNKCKSGQTVYSTSVSSRLKG